MSVKYVKLILIVAAAQAILACETVRECAPNCPTDEEALAQAGAVRLQAQQVKARVSEKTEAWVHGGAYYHSDGALEVKWRKVRYKGSWEVAADGTLCYQLPNWQRRCHFYMDKMGQVYLLDEGRNIGVMPVFDGNRLTNLGHYVTGLDRKK